MNLKCKSIIPVLLSAALLCGCSASGKEKNDNSYYWQPTSYTLAEIEEKYSSFDHNTEREQRAEDVTDEALEKYNILLGYAESVLGQDYTVYDFYYADWAGEPDWLVKIVPDDTAERVQSDPERVSFYYDDIILLFYSEAGRVRSGIEPYYMALRYTQDIKQEFAEKYPDYGIEMDYSDLFEYYLDVTDERIEAMDDYTVLINDSYYDNMDQWSYGNIINIIVPPGTLQKNAYDIFLETESVLRKYCVTEVTIFAPEDEEARREWAEEEQINTNNHSHDNNLDWTESFDLRKEIANAS